MVQLVFSAIFSAVEGYPYGTAFYHCFVTATTVGYGDVSISSSGGRLVAIFHIILSVVLLAEMLNTIDTLRTERYANLQRVKQLERQLDAQLYEQLLECATKLRPKVERDGLGLSELEFAMSMLIELEVIEWSQVRPAIHTLSSPAPTITPLTRSHRGVVAGAPLYQEVPQAQRLGRRTAWPE